MKQHVDKNNSPTGNHDTFMKQHQMEIHENRPAELRAKMTGTFGDCLSRQFSEAIKIRRSDKPVLNSKKVTTGSSFKTRAMKKKKVFRPPEAIYSAKATLERAK